MTQRISGLLSLALLCLLLAVPASAQEQTATEQSEPRAQTAQAGKGEQERIPHRKVAMDFTIGGLRPGGDLLARFSGTTGIGFNLGFRPHRFIQLEGGFEAGNGAAGVSRTINTTGGPRSVGDTEYFVPLGVRFVLPLFKERLQLSGGGGGAFIRYQETPKSGANETVICTSCVSRSGGGAYEVMGTKLMVDNARHFGFGLTTRWYQATSNGDALGGTALRAKSHDRWTTIAGTMSFHF